MEAALAVNLYSARELEAFEKALRRADSKNADEFRELLNWGLDLLRLLHQDIADECDASRPTVTRWVNGLNAPTPTVRKAVYRYMLGRTIALKRRVQERESEERERQRTVQAERERDKMAA
jgi:hypothetical protein